MSSGTERLASLDAANLTALWAGVRLVVIDTETTKSPDGGPLRAVAVARVTCRNATIRGTWNSLVDPGVPIDPISQSIHGITDDHVKGEPDFAAVAHLILPAFEPVEDERVVVVGHNVGFDVSVLRHELRLTGHDIPELATLDTMRLAPHLGATGTQPSLDALCETLSISRQRAHDAHADAYACAQAAIALLDLAARQGHADFDALLAAVGRGATTRTVKPSRKGGKPRDPAASAPHLPTAHTEGHSNVLSKRAGRKMIEAWAAQVAECAELRCVHLTARVAAAQAPDAVVVEQLHRVLTERTSDNDTAGAATVLAGLIPLLRTLPAARGRLGFRTTALNWAATWSPKLTALKRCNDKDLCPDCREGYPCPLDLWPDTIAGLALGPPDKYARGYFEMTGKDAGTGAYTTWLARGVDHRVTDAAVALCVEHWRRIDQTARAHTVAHLAWKAGCRHPDVADTYAGQLAKPGRTTDLTQAIDVCDTALATRDGSTHEGWQRLHARRAQLAGRLQRLHHRPSGEFDADGHSIPARRHHPSAPQRTRTPRFQRR